MANETLTNEEVEGILESLASVSTEAISQELIDEATRFGTVPTGDYRLEVSKKEWRFAYQPDAATGKAQPSRIRAHLQLTVKDPQKGMKKIGTIFPDASPEIVRQANGQMDNKSKLWLQLAKIHNAGKRGISHLALFDEIGKYPYNGKVKELFVVPQSDGTERLLPGTMVEIAEWRGKGYRSLNVVNSVTEVK
jgi:hypothetical protein